MFPVSSLLKMVNDHGQSLTIVHKKSDEYDPVTGDFTEVTLSYTFTGYFYNDLSGLLQQQDIERGSRALLIPYANLQSSFQEDNLNPDLVLVFDDTPHESISEPSIGDVVTGQRDSVKIVSKNLIYSGVDPVCFVLGVSE